MSKENVERPDLKFENTLRNSVIDSSRGQYPGKLAGHGEKALYLEGPINHLALFGKAQVPRCSPFEMDYYRCASRVGLINVQRGNDCLMEFEDYKECLTRAKSIKRQTIMRKEARRQGKPFLEEPVQYTNINFNNDGCNIPFV